MRWLLVFLIASIVLSGLMPYLARLGFGKLPGDVAFKAFGRDWQFPLGSALLFSFAFWVISAWI
jgi:hypothetical protein